MTEHTAKVPFVSCIKVRGIHLLPPVITQKRRSELQGYKQQAIKLEKRLKNCRDLKKNLESLLNMQPLTNRPPSEISFKGDSHIDALGITEKSSDSLSSKTRSRKMNLSRDIIDVTQYDSNGIKILYNGDNYLMSPSNTSIDKTEEGQIELSSQMKSYQANNDGGYLSQNSSKLNKESDDDISFNGVRENYCVKKSDVEKSQKPRLIRSNSYTLETPSPILLAHLEKSGKYNKSEEVRNFNDIKHLSVCRNWSSLENNYVPFEDSEFSSINTVYNNYNCANKDETSSTPFEAKEQNPSDQNTPPAIKVIQTDISVQNITVNASNEILNEALDENCETSDSQLLQVLRTLPETYSKQIMELIESQKQNKQKSVNQTGESEVISQEKIPTKSSRESINENNLTSSRRDDLFDTTTKSNMSRSLSIPIDEKLDGSTISISPSQSIYYSTTSSDTLRPLSNSSVPLNDFECDDTVTNENSDSPKKTVITDIYVRENTKKRFNVSRELFPHLNADTINIIKQEWAASIIGAHVKGYLTRRLLKTARVQSLIETIKDALVCALELHNAENIDESDVELHRRLINQVSAACYTFHDIFFSLTVKEQMSLIATDRQRKLEKAKRPSSAPNSVRSKSSARSTPIQGLPTHSRSLTKV